MKGSSYKRQLFTGTHSDLAPTNYLKHIPKPATLMANRNTPCLRAISKPETSNFDNAKYNL